MLTVAVVYDFTTEKIPNELIIIGLISGLAYRLLCGKDISVGKLMLDLFFPLILFFLFFVLRLFGAGDIKLLMVCGLFLGTNNNLRCICLALAVAAMNGLLRLFIHGKFRKRFDSLLRHVKTSLCVIKQGGREIDSYLTKEKAEKVAKVHFSLPILLGVTLTLLFT